jgi:DNA-binding NarL/FixJ family response regulator
MDDAGLPSDGSVRHEDVSERPLRVVVVDDHPLFRQGVALTLGAAAGVEVVGEGASADDAIRLAGELRPDVALVDVTMPGRGLAAARRITSSCPETKVIMLTVSEAEDDVTEALKGGARGYILKGVSAAELVEIVRAVARGEGYISPALAASMLAQLTCGRGEPATAEPAARAVPDSGSGAQTGAAPPAASGEPPRRPDLLQELTERERQILERVAGGDSNKEVARDLHLAEKTVKHYMTSILQKLQARNRVEAALMARGDLPPSHRTWLE